MIVFARGSSFSNKTCANSTPGPATDNEVGMRYVREELGLPAANARTTGALLADLVEEQTFKR